MAIADQTQASAEPAVDSPWLDGLVRAHPGDVVAVAQVIQQRLGWVPRSWIEAAARGLGMHAAQAFGVLSFYASLSLRPQGRVRIRVCEGTACHVRGSTRVAEALQAHLHIKPGATTADFQYTLETVACLGCCSLAPVMTIGGRTHARIDRLRAVSALSEASAGVDEDDLLGLGEVGQ